MNNNGQMTKKERFKKGIKSVERQLKNSDLDENQKSNLEDKIQRLEQRLEEATRSRRNRRDLVESIGSMAGLSDDDYMVVSEDSNAGFRVSGLEKIEEVLKECEKRLNNP